MLRRISRTFVTVGATIACGLLVSASFGQGDQVLEVNNGMERFDGHQVIRAYLRSADDLALMRALSPDVWSESSGIGPVDYRLPPESLDALNGSGIAYDVLIPDLQLLLNAEHQRLAANAQHGGGMVLGPEWYTEYHALADVMTYMDSLAADFPDLATVSTIGLSIEGRPIRALHITGAGGSDRPTIVIESNQHAREWVTLPGTMYIAEQLLTGYGTDPAITTLVDSANVHVIVSVNPDGYEYSWVTNRMWRKNRRDNGGGIFGVDTNRNWASGWGGPGSSGDPNSNTYRGTAPFSEPETKAMSDFMNSLPRLDAFIDYHSYSQLVLQPWGWTIDLPPDHATLDYVGGLMSDAAIALYGKSYVHGPSYTTIYPASGVAGDWPYEAHGAIAYTIEMRDTGQFGFILPPEQILPAAEEGFAAFMEMVGYTLTQLRISFPSGLPAQVEPDTVTPFQVQIVGVNGGTYQDDSGILYAQISGAGSFDAYPLVALGGDLFEAMLPAAACGETLEFYLEAKTTANSTQRMPVGAPDEFYRADSINLDEVFADNFESDKGWTVENVDLSDGAWERGVPAGAGDRGDPLSDFDGSGQCYLTDNVEGNSDVDGGPTRLISPLLDLSAGDALISYARWFFNDDNDADALTIEVSNDGGTNWTLVESVGNTGGWEMASFMVGDFVTPTAEVVVRFNATDNPNDSVTEAAIDAFTVARTGCNGADCLDLGVTNLVAGEQALFAVAGATPNSTVAVLYALQRGEFVYTDSNWCVDFGLQIPLSKALSRIVVQGVADGNGDFSELKFIPGGTTGLTIHLQAAEKGTCPDSCMSNITTAVVQ